MYGTHLTDEGATYVVLLEFSKAGESLTFAIDEEDALRVAEAIIETNKRRGQG